MKTPHWQRELVLVGGGHSHVLALRMLAMNPVPGCRTTLVSLDGYTPYSGMLPGLIAGHYQYRDVHIDLRRYCARLGVRFIAARAEGLDLDRQRLHLHQRPALAFDVLSMDIGAQPGGRDVPGVGDHAIPVKPIHGFYRRWQAVQRALQDAPPHPRRRLVLVGGGAGSVELALAMRHRLGAAVDLLLVCGQRMLEGYAAATRKTVRSWCSRLGVEVVEHSQVTRVGEGLLSIADGGEIPFDDLFWCTSAEAEPWLAETGLACDDRGFPLVRNTLQLLHHEQLFAAGDVASQLHHPRPKAGVYAVRQAPVLARNLAAYLQRAPLRDFVPQRRYLSLLSLGERCAVAERGLLRASGAWVWRWKDRIDTRFMQQFVDLPGQMPEPPEAEPPMHCGGCGAKLPATPLRRVLAELSSEFPGQVDSQLLADDAAPLVVPRQVTLLQSVDVLRLLVDDPWLMGRLAMLHALGDLHAMGARPHSALAHVTLPYAGPEIQISDLYQLLAGALRELSRENAKLLGGHTLEGSELILGFTVNGLSTGESLEKNGLVADDCLVLCKPLGTGVLFAAQQQGLARSEWIGAALDSMLCSNAGAADIARRHGVRAATDITGFGLLGHLGEMLLDPDLQAQLTPGAIPLLQGVEDCYQLGVLSSLQAANIDNARPLLAASEDLRAAEMQPWFDPQTCGGLLLGVAPQRCDELLQELRAAGYHSASEIGRVRGPRPPQQPTIILG